MVAETRNYLIAASQNITNTHHYLSNVNIPYFNSEDLRVRGSQSCFFVIIVGVCNILGMFGKICKKS